MLKIVEAASNHILFSVDAWCLDCMDRAAAYTRENNLIVIRKEITFMGDMIWWVG